MIKIQEAKKQLIKLEKVPSNLFPQRITQLASNSYQKFMNKYAKTEESRVKPRRKESECIERQLVKPKQQNMVFFLNDTNTVSKDAEQQLDNNNSVDALYLSKKTHYINFLKNRQEKYKPQDSQDQLKARPFSVFNFNESFFYDELNLIKRKKKYKSSVQNRASRLKTTSRQNPQVIVFEPQQITKKQSQAINQFFFNGKEKQISEQSVVVPQKAKINIVSKTKFHTKKRFMSKLQSKTLPVEYSPFKNQSAKRNHFIFGLYERPSDTKYKQRLLNYHDFIWKVNYSNCLLVKATPKDASFNLFIGIGNNSNMIKSIARRRFWWSITNNPENCNFVWTQIKIDTFHASQKNSYNHLDHLYLEKEDQQNLLFHQYKSENKIFNLKDYTNWCSYLKDNSKGEENVTQKTYKNRSTFAQKKKLTKIQNSRQLQVHNHFIQNGFLGNKKALFYLMKNYYQKLGDDVFKVLPLTFHICQGINDPEWKIFQKIYTQYESIKSNGDKNANIWIIKPGQCTNQGTGINVYHELEDIRLRLKSKQRNKDGSLRTFILQKYIQNPLLYFGRKFDIRHFLLITCFNGIFKAYWFEEGYGRTSSTAFSLKRGSSLFAHLTNDAIQKGNKDYNKFEEGNKVSYEKLSKYIRKSGFNTDNNPFQNIILPKMKEITLDAVKATVLSLDPNRKQHNFQLFGMDFMIDQNLKPWLIQINTNPCLQICCPLLSNLIPDLLEQTFRITIDPLFPPPQQWPSGRKMWTPENLLEKNRFHLIFDESTDGKELKNLLGQSLELKRSIGKIEQESQLFESEGISLTEQNY